MDPSPLASNHGPSRPRPAILLPRHACHTRRGRPLRRLCPWPPMTHMTHGTHGGAKVSHDDPDPTRPVPPVRKARACLRYRPVILTSAHPWPPPTYVTRREFTSPAVAPGPGQPLAMNMYMCVEVRSAAPAQPSMDRPRRPTSSDARSGTTSRREPSVPDGQTPFLADFKFLATREQRGESRSANRNALEIRPGWPTLFDASRVQTSVPISAPRRQRWPETSSEFVAGRSRRAHGLRCTREEARSGMPWGDTSFGTGTSAADLGRALMSPVC